MKNIIKFSTAGLGIVLLGIGAISGVQYLKYRYSDEYKAEMALKKLIEEYENDPYGGATPEETLNLFIDALKKGDIELAAKYFVMEKREEEKNKLELGKEKGNLQTLINILSRAGYGKEIYEGKYLMSVVNNKNEEEYSITMKKTKKSNKWKIEEL